MAPTAGTGSPRWGRRELTYFAVRGAAALGFVLSAVVLPHGGAAALVAIACGLVAVLTCLATNAGGPGEQSGSAPFQRAYDRVRAPQGDWPPYDPSRVVDGELVD